MADNSKHISADMVELIDSQSLEAIMQREGYAVDHKAGNNLFYQCPFHTDSNASFSVTAIPKDGAKGEYYCHGCKEKGYGAISLKARLMGLDRTDPKSFIRICTAIAKIFNLQDPVDPGRQANDNWRRARRVETPSSEIRYTYKEWEDADLRALGCKVRQAFVTRNKVSQAVLGSEGNPVKIYSWGGDGYYRSSCKESHFSPDCITRLFGIRPVESFVTEERADPKTGELQSWTVKSSPDYPIFDMHYDDPRGWKSKKYEPNARPDRNGNSYKFTWWFQDGRNREEDSSLRQALYGDMEFMHAFATGQVTPPSAAPAPSSHSCEGPKKPTIEVVVNPEDTKPRVRVKFRRLIICSGPRDGLNVYFHSDAHVCWPHSEVTGLSESTIGRLLSIAHEVYVLFDTDRTGKRNAEDIAMQNLGVKVIYLPEDLSTLQSSRTGRPCKDAAEYFSNYPAVLKHNRAFRDKTINDHFESLLVKAHSMKFWDEQYAMRKAENGVDKYVRTKYTLNPTNMAQFLGASGMYRYTDTSNERQYVMIASDGVHIIPKEDIHLTAKQLMKNYLCEHPQYYRDDLMNMISLSTKLSPQTIEEIPQINLDFRAWGEDFDYLYFQNGALHVTPDSMKLVPYSQMPYAVNVDSKVDGIWKPTGEQLFDIVLNPDYEKKCEEHRRRLQTCRTQEEKETELKQFSQYQRLWKYRLVLNRPMEEMPPVIQYVYDMGRMYWKIEDSGGHLTEDQKQFQDMQFVNKCGAYGYLQSRFRTSVLQRMVTITDYSLLREDRANGRNGKSTNWQMLSFTRKGLWIDGKNFKKKSETVGQNFHELRLTVHNFIFIDDLSRDVDADKFYNMVSRIKIKSLYNNEVTLSPEDSPKLFVTYNKPFDVNNKSTYGRLWPTFASDYYHAEDVMGTQRTRSMASKFRHDIFKPRSEREAQHIREFLAQCLQFYLREYNRDIESVPIIAPVDQDGLAKMMYGEFNFDCFMDWGNLFFDPANCAHHFEHPISIDEIVISLLRYDGSREVTYQNVRKFRAQVVKDLHTYCSIFGIVINPQIVCSDSDYVRGVSRKTAWVSEKNDFDRYEIDYRRYPRHKESVDCMYFYQRGSQNVQFPVPLSVSDIKKATETDYGDLI